MRKIIVALVATLLLSTGCTIQVDSKPSDTPSASVSATPSPTVEDPDTLFLSVIRDEYPMFENVPDKTLIGIAKDVCGMWDNGATVEDVFQIVAEGGTSDKMMEAMGFLIGAGTVAYCPEHKDILTQGLPT